MAKEHIDSNKPFPVGAKVRITDYKYPNIVMKIKKDGTAHPRSRVWVGLPDKMELIGT